MEFVVSFKKGGLVKEPKILLKNIVELWHSDVVETIEMDGFTPYVLKISQDRILKTLLIIVFIYISERQRLTYMFFALFIVLTQVNYKRYFT